MASASSKDQLHAAQPLAQQASDDAAISSDPGTSTTAGVHDLDLDRQRFKASVGGDAADIQDALRRAAAEGAREALSQGTATLLGRHPVIARVLIVTLLGGAGGAGWLWGGAGGPASTETLQELTEAHVLLENRVKDLEGAAQISRDAYEMSALALEISVESHRYVSDLIVDATKLDHPEYQPPAEDVRLQRRLMLGSQILSSLDAPGRLP